MHLSSVEPRRLWAAVPINSMQRYLRSAVLRFCFVECYDDPTLISTFELFCSKNENGTLCYDTVEGLLEDEGPELEEACEDATTMSCSVSCMEELEKSNSETGYCLYTLAALFTSQQETDDIWAACDVDTPDLCTGRFTGEPIKAPESGAATVTSYVSILVVTLIMASTDCL